MTTRTLDLVTRLARTLDPRLLAVAGAACISVSAILMKTSGTSAATAGLFRCVLALPVLLPLALAERHRTGPRPWRRGLVDLGAGLLLGVDLVFWGMCIGRLGAGIATVLVNVQVVIVPLLAWLVHRERMSVRFLAVVPVMLVGVALAAGVAGTDAEASLTGALLGVAAGAAYAGYLFLLRGGGEAVRHQVQPVLAATVGAAVTSLVLGLATSSLDLTPGWPAWGWLAALALSGQVCGWLLITAALPRLRANVGPTLLLLQPVLAVLLSVLLLGERPGGWQLAGCAVVVLGVWATTTGRAARRPAPAASVRSPVDARVGHGERLGAAVGDADHLRTCG